MKTRKIYKQIREAVFCLLFCFGLLCSAAAQSAYAHDTRMMDIFGMGQAPSDEDVLMYRGNVYARTGMYERAVEEYGKVIALDSLNVLAHINRAITLMDLARFREALADMHSAERLEPDNYEVYINRALVYAALEKLDSAVLDCDRALEINGDAAEAYANRGNYLARLGEFDEGLADCEHAIAIDSTYAQAWLGSTLIYLELSDFDRAKASFRTLLRYETADMKGIVGQLHLLIDTSQAAN